MAQLYRSKWECQEGEILDARDQYTSGFLFWCRKTNHLTDEQWRRGFKALEDEMKEAERLGESRDLWPPSYAAFVEKCEQTRINAGMYRHFDQSTAIEDKTAKEKRYSYGLKQTEKLLSLFD